MSLSEMTTNDLQIGFKPTSVVLMPSLVVMPIVNPVHTMHGERHRIDRNHKYEICVEAKMAKSPIHAVDSSNKPLGLIHTDIRDLKCLQSRGVKMIFYYILLRSKDETKQVFIHYKIEVENQLTKRIKMLRSNMSINLGRSQKSMCIMF